MNNPEENLIPAFMKEFAAFFDQQHQEAEQALRYAYAVHEAHLIYLEYALSLLKHDELEEAAAALRRFFSEEEQRLYKQARLQSFLGRREQSPHHERQNTLLRQLSEAIQSKGRSHTNQYAQPSTLLDGWIMANALHTPKLETTLSTHEEALTFPSGHEETIDHSVLESLTRFLLDHAHVKPLSLGSESEFEAYQSKQRNV